MSVTSTMRTEKPKRSALFTAVSKHLAQNEIIRSCLTAQAD